MHEPAVAQKVLHLCAHAPVEHHDGMAAVRDDEVAHFIEPGVGLFVTNIAFNAAKRYRTEVTTKSGQLANTYEGFIQRQNLLKTDAVADSSQAFVKVAGVRAIPNRAAWEVRNLTTGEAYQAEADYVYVHVSSVRRKLNAVDPDAKAGALIVTEPGVGYRVEAGDGAP